MDAVLILHGLGSSNDSEKIRWFRGNLGMEVFAPNFPQHGDNESEFSVPLILEQMDEVISRMRGFDRKYLVARSFGGYVALLLMKRYPDFFDGVCLLSPVISMRETMGILVDDGYVSLDFKIGGRRFVGPDEFVCYDLEVADVSFDVPVLVIHGARDVVARVDVLREFVEGRDNVRLEMFDMGHDYGDCAGEVVRAVKDFLSEGI